MNPVPSAKVAHVVTQIFREPAYQWSASESLLGRVLLWCLLFLDRVWHAVSSVPGGALVAKLTAAALVLLVVGALLYQLTVTVWPSRRARTLRVRTLDRDPWGAADRCAREGAYVDAAHWLYSAVVHRLAAHGEVRFHPSKTAGDYLRELRRGQRRGALEHVLPFVRAYEIIVYRDERCDAAEYAQLKALAESAQQRYQTAA